MSMLRKQTESGGIDSMTLPAQGREKGTAWELICPPYGYLIISDETARNYALRLLKDKWKP